MPICKSIVRQSYGHLRAGPRRPRLRLGYGWGAFCKAFALHEVTSETESRARLVKNEACDPKHLGDFRAWHIHVFHEMTISMKNSDL